MKGAAGWPPLFLGRDCFAGPDFAYDPLGVILRM